MKSLSPHLLLCLLLGSPALAAVIPSSQYGSQNSQAPEQTLKFEAIPNQNTQNSVPTDRKAMLFPPMPLPFYHDFAAKNLGSENVLPGSDKNAEANGQFGAPGFAAQMAMMNHPMSPVSPFNPVNNPLINQLHPLNPGNPVQHHFFKRDGTFEVVRDEGIPGMGMELFGMNQNYDTQDSDITDPETTPIMVPKITVRSKCDSVKRQAISIANSVMKTQNSIVYSELINYLTKSKFLLGMTEIKLARLLRKRMYSVMKQFSSLTPSNIDFVDAAFDDGTTGADSIDSLDILNGKDYPDVDHYVGDIQPNAFKKKKL